MILRFPADIKKWRTETICDDCQWCWKIKTFFSLFKYQWGSMCFSWNYFNWPANIRQNAKAVPIAFMCPLRNIHIHCHQCSLHLVILVAFWVAFVFFSCVSWALSATVEQPTVRKWPERWRAREHFNYRENKSLAPNIYCAVYCRSTATKHVFIVIW